MKIMGTEVNTRLAVRHNYALEFKTITTFLIRLLIYGWCTWLNLVVLKYCASTIAPFLFCCWHKKNIEKNCLKSDAWALSFLLLPYLLNHQIVYLHLLLPWPVIYELLVHALCNWFIIIWLVIKVLAPWYLLNLLIINCRTMDRWLFQRDCSLHAFAKCRWNGFSRIALSIYQKMKYFQKTVVATTWDLLAQDLQRILDTSIRHNQHTWTSDCRSFTCVPVNSRFQRTAWIHI